MAKKSSGTVPDSRELALEKVQRELAAAREAQQRSLADYQNLVRRTQDEKRAWSKFAVAGFVEDLLQPLEHLSLAAEQLNDAGLTMVVQQLWQALEQHGLKELKVLGEPFDPETMEAVEADPAKARDSDAQVVQKVIRRGFMLHDRVIQHAKVALSTQSSQK